jgi:hypothetical protein
MDVEWQQLVEYYKRDVPVSCEFEGVCVHLKITAADTLANGERWISLQFLDHPEFSPHLFGHPLGNANSLFEPRHRRPYRGWMSCQVFETIRVG